MQLVTIISDLVLLERPQSRLREEGATGVTITEVKGEDSKHAKASEVRGDKDKILNDQGFTIQKAIPSVISGKDIVTSAITKMPVIVLPFQLEFGEFHVEICSEASI